MAEAIMNTRGRKLGLLTRRESRFRCCRVSPAHYAGRRMRRWLLRLASASSLLQCTCCL